MRFLSLKKYQKWILWTLLIVLMSFGIGRLYYRVTGGFTIGNITHDLPYEPKWEIHPHEDQKREMDAILSQKFYYLGKGCQSYVFKSEDGNYVLKFFKYQRFRPKAWLSFFSFIPQVEKYRLKKIEKKQRKLDRVFTSWKIAYEDLQPETGVIFVHLNKSNHLKKMLSIYDKMGIEHRLNSDDFEFMVQKKAKMLCPTIDEMIVEGRTKDAQDLLDKLLFLIVSEYHRGYADNDHALMQNTGVWNENPVHIDVGQFVKNPNVKNPALYNQELFNKTWKFRKWLAKRHPELADHLVMRLKEIIGETTFGNLQPRLNKSSMGGLSHHD